MFCQETVGSRASGGYLFGVLGVMSRLLMCLGLLGFLRNQGNQVYTI